MNKKGKVTKRSVSPPHVQLSGMSKSHKTWNTRRSPRIQYLPISSSNGSDSTVHIIINRRRRPRPTPPTPPPLDPIPDVKPVFRPTSMIPYRAAKESRRKYKYVHRNGKVKK